ncbi:efflux RND transporter periplasmic adaptor subunit [Adhaeretor mobilis]|uniref:Macrolide export protein MacA n=1 Tax=Adhaeretor mobilis TaxID=1930276 RepID=A0A517MYE8_9BACT|nr:efflux RND transporter periplasmic adaptor subunit [Adhaeretor mobilis]QDS99910.1 Macrolide export protein MacA [Adhaeretor mobilis]
MKKFYLLLAVLTIGAIAAYKPLARGWEERSKPAYKTAEVDRRTIKLVVNSTGEVKPVLEVAIGSFVSGPIKELYVDFNDRVSKGQLLAEIDTRIYDAAVARDRATLVTRQADVKRVQAQLQQATNDEARSVALRSESVDYISQTEIDQFHFTRMSLAAQLEVAEAAVEQAVATLENSEANLGYAEIRSPVDGIVIKKMIDLGQTLAAQFQTPELFVIAPEMDKRMHVFASVDEADIGLIRRAQVGGLSVQFTVDAYPDDLFEGKIEQIRFSPTENQNVVTYPVVVSAANPDLKLLPGMTASLSFTIEVKEDVLCVPNAALRFYPEEKELVREKDRKLLEAGQEQDRESKENASAEQKVDDGKKRDKRHVWVANDGKLRATEITTGISDNRFTEIVSGDLEKDQELVTGKKTN